MRTVAEEVAAIKEKQKIKLEKENKDRFEYMQRAKTFLEKALKNIHFEIKGSKYLLFTVNYDNKIYYITPIWYEHKSNLEFTCRSKKTGALSKCITCNPKNFSVSFAKLLTGEL